MDTHISQSPEETEQFGERLAKTLANGSVVGLIGDLGAGKTQFVKGVARGLGIHCRIHSPSFTLVNEYASVESRLCHLDLYRLETSDQILGAGLDQYVSMNDAIVVIEWFDRWTNDLPQPAAGLIVHIKTLNENERELSYEPFGS